MCLFSKREEKKLFSSIHLFNDSEWQNCELTGAPFIWRDKKDIVLYGSTDEVIGHQIFLLKSLIRHNKITICR